MTIAVFSRNQFNGPEGALRRFVLAVAKGDHAKAIEAGANEAGPVLDQLAAEVFLNLRARGVYEVVEILGEGDRRIAVVDVRFPPNRVDRTLWALGKVGRRWYVDVVGSARLRGWPV